jgi:hypothetical protein
MGHRLVQTRRGEILPAGCNTDLSLRCPRINPDTRGGLQALFLFPCTPERKKGVPVLLHPGGPTPPPHIHTNKESCGWQNGPSTGAARAQGTQKFEPKVGSSRGEKQKVRGWLGAVLAEGIQVVLFRRWMSMQMP